mmetsp:Transcript_19429/g.42445  ORF Transcript_19429/g.42445 Transcript_19429/m.42445 type:complete len:511 (+) Transcript_19429:85-1617(+)
MVKTFLEVPSRQSDERESVSRSSSNTVSTTSSLSSSLAAGKAKKGRKSNHGAKRPGRPGRRKPRPSTSSKGSAFSQNDSSSSSDDLDHEDWDELDIDALPLHLREGTVTKQKPQSIDHADKGTPSAQEPEERHLQLAVVDQNNSAYLRQMPTFQSPKVEVLVKRQALWIVCGLCCAWSALATALLLVYGIRIYEPVYGEVHRLVAHAAILRATMDAAQILAPALAVLRTLSLAAHSGFNSSDPILLSLLLAPDMYLAHAVKQVRLVGSGAAVTLIHWGLTLSPGHLPQISEIECSARDRLSCLGLNVSRLIQAPGNLAVGWQEPDFLRVDAEGEPVSAEQWRLVHHLSSQVVGESFLLAVDLAVDLGELGTEAAERKVSVYFCTEDGTLLAGSNWRPRALANQKGELIYPHLVDLPLPWVSVPGLRGLTSAEMWHGRDLIAVSPLDLGDGTAFATASRSALRVVVHVPFEAAVHSALPMLAIAALVGAALPLVGLPLLLMILCRTPRSRR